MESRIPESRVDEIMERIREEIALRKTSERQSIPTAEPPSHTSSQSPAPSLLSEPPRLPRPLATPALPIRPSDTLHVNDFLGFSDSEFLTHAFHGVFRRPPQPDELARYLELSHVTGLPHLEILGRLRYSEEGKRQAVRIEGLCLRFHLHRLYRSFPRLTYFIKWLHDFILLPNRISALRRDDALLRNRLADQVEILSSATENALQTLVLRIDDRFRRLENKLFELESRIDIIDSAKAGVDSVDPLYVQLTELRNLPQEMVTLREKFARLESTNSPQQSALKEIQRHLDDLGAQVRDDSLLRNRLADEAKNLSSATENAFNTLSALSQEMFTLREKFARLESTNSPQQRALKEIQRHLDDLGAQVRDNKLHVLDQQRRMALLIEEARRRLPKPIETDQLESMARERDHLLDAQYVAFEDRFRGTRADIKQRQSVYIPYIKSLNLDIKKYPALDIGCGRGEWLELLADAAIHARGIDINRVMVQQCRERDLDVEEADCLEFLRRQKAGSLSVLTSFHVVEHLQHDILIEFLDEALRVLRPGGMIILETPNPSNLLVGTSTFFLDPTHHKPINSTALQFLLEARGFCRPKVIYLHPYDPSYRLHGSELAERISDLLYGPQDYAAIGYKA